MAPPGNLILSYLRLQPLPSRRVRPIVASFPSSRDSSIVKPRILYPRDIKIEIGRYKGSRLGTVPSSYLKWLTGQVDPSLSYWSGLAERVLQDPVYQDRIEWEPAFRLFTGEAKGTFYRKGSFDVMKAYREIGERFGWDMDDKEAWSKVNRDLIGTSFTGRIPRKKKERFQLGASESVKRVESEESEKRNEPLVGGKRGERIERMRLKREKVPVRIEEKGEVNKGEEFGNLDSQNCVKQGTRSGFLVGRKRGERIERMRLNRERNVQMEKSDKAEEEILEEKEEEAPRITMKKERISRRTRDLEKGKRELDLGRNAEVISFTKRVESSGNAEIFNPFPGRDALFEKIRSRKD